MSSSRTVERWCASFLLLGPGLGDRDQGEMVTWAGRGHVRVFYMCIHSNEFIGQRLLGVYFFVVEKIISIGRRARVSKGVPFAIVSWCLRPDPCQGMILSIINICVCGGVQRTLDRTLLLENLLLCLLLHLDFGDAYSRMRRS